VQASDAPGHHAVALGMAGGVLAWTGVEVATVLLYSTTSLLIGAALRLLPMGQGDGQRVLWALHPVIERVAGEAARRRPADLWSFAPGLDIHGARHERLEARLFRS
jgi:urease accessory protein